MQRLTAISRNMALSCALLAALLIADRAGAEDYFRSYTVAGPATVRVKVDDSRVRVLTSDTNQVEFRVTSEGFAAIKVGGELHVDSRQDGNTVILTVHVAPQLTLLFNTKRLSTEVQMPKNADLQLETSDGRVELSDLNGKILVHTANGSIKASQLSGSIDLLSKDGDIVADTIKGAFKLESGNGKITGTGLDGECRVFASDGSIHVDGRFDSLDIESANGSVTAHAEAGSKISSSWNITTKDGTVDVEVPKDLRANLDAQTDDGHISLGLPVSSDGNLSKQSVRGTINGGGPTLFIRTGNGSIRLNGV